MSTRDELTRQADKALRQGRPDQAIELYQQLAVLVPIDWNQVKQLADLLERGSQREAAAEQFLRYADYLFTEGFHSRAAALYKKVLKLEPTHERALWQLGEVSLELKLRADARQAFQRVLDQRLRQHDEAGVAEVRRRLAALDPTVSPASAPDPPTPSDPIAPAAPTPASLESAHPDPAGTSPGDVTAEAPTPPESVDAHLARRRRAAEQAESAGDAALERLQGSGILTTDGHLGWVEICVDAGVDGLSRAQHALARSYLAADHVSEARAVAEDVFVRESGAEPFRALLLEILEHDDEADPHRVLVELLAPPSDDGSSMDSWLVATETAWASAAAPSPSGPAVAETPGFDWSLLLGREVEGDPFVRAGVEPALEIENEGGPADDPQPGRLPSGNERVVEEEVDLTDLLEQLKQWDPELPEPLKQRSEQDAPRVLPAGGTTDTADGDAELDAVFADLQRQADPRTVAEQQIAAGRVLLAAGLSAEAARAFERASLEPRTRFEATEALAELHRSRGQLHDAVRWFEQAAMAPVPDAAMKRAVLYDLAESLEALGETDRALGVLLDLLSQVEDYREARARVDRLLRVDSGG